MDNCVSEPELVVCSGVVLVLVLGDAGGGAAAGNDGRGLLEAGNTFL